MAREDDEEGLGGRFWLAVIGVSLGAAIGGFLLFVLIGWAWVAFGLFGMLLFFGALLIAVAWLVDRRDAKRSSELMV
jgi:hypothetical protein